MLEVPVSWGELIDKITILMIKSERIGDPAKRANVERELMLLTERLGPAASTPGLSEAMEELVRVNGVLWDIEDAIRDCEARSDFGPDFIALARSVYVTNDERAAIKRRINMAMQSGLVEEKSYRNYKTG